jgi:hypothetical protein
MSTTITFRYAPPVGGDPVVGWAPPHYSTYGSILIPAHLVPHNDPKAVHIIDAGELFDVVMDSDFHNSIRYDPTFVRATRTEIARDDGKLTIDTTPPVPQPSTEPFWGGREAVIEDDDVWRFANDMPRRLADKGDRDRRSDGYE